MALPIEDVLSLWREAERVLEELPADAPERRVVSAELVNLKRIYKRLTSESDATAETLGQSRVSIEAAHATLARARAHLDAE
ncbi:MAG: hypothetical protein ACJ765_00985 [Chloroflexota bacterium]